MTLFIYLKIILLWCFQISIFNFKKNKLYAGAEAAWGEGGALAPPDSVKMPYIGDAFLKSLTL